MSRCEPREYHKPSRCLLGNWTHARSLARHELRRRGSQRDSRWRRFSTDRSLCELARRQRKPGTGKFFEFAETTLSIVVLNLSARPSERSISRHKSRQHWSNERARINGRSAVAL